MAGLDPAIPLREARPRHMIGIAGSSPAMTIDGHPIIHQVILIGMAPRKSCLPTSTPLWRRMS
jgi:hypothetical protein